MTFDKKKHLIKVQGGRVYLPVSARLVWFRQEHPDWSIETEAVEINNEKQYAIFRARICDGGGKLMATGTKKEDVKGFGDWLEKSETGAIGRALALCGFSTDADPDLDDGQQGDMAQSQQDGTPQASPREANVGKEGNVSGAACNACGRHMTRGQVEYSQQRYGNVFCPACQPKGAS